MKGRWPLLRIQNLKTIIPIPMSLLHLSSFPPWRNSQFDSEENTSQFDPSLNRSMVFYVNIYIASLNVYILQLIKLKKRDYMVFEIEFCVWIVQKTTVLHTAEWLTKEKESSCRRVDREKTTLIRSRRCSVANTSSSRLATFFMVYTIVINYTFELIINWHRFCFWKISNSNILYNKRIKSIFLRFKNIYFLKKFVFFFVFF